MATAQASLLRNAFLYAPAGLRKFEVPLIKGEFRGIVYVLLHKRVAFCKDAVVEGREDEIGLAKASPFSFLPEASLLASPSLSKEGLGSIVGVLSADGLVEADSSDEIGYCAGKPAP